MTENIEKISHLIADAIDEIDLDDDPGDISMDTVLYGDDGLLDSIQLVNLIVAVEQRVEEEMGFSVAIADEKAISQRNSPFRTVGTLCDYISGIVAK